MWDDEKKGEDMQVTALFAEDESRDEIRGEDETRLILQAKRGASLETTRGW